MMGKKQVLTSRWTMFGSILLAIACLTTMSMLSVPGNSPAFNVVVAGVGILFGVMAIRVGISRVVLTQSEIDIRGPLRRRRYEKSQVLEFGLEPLDEKLTLCSWAPTLLRSDGHVDVLRLLAGYSPSDEVPNRRVGRQHELLETWLTRRD